MNQSEECPQCKQKVLSPWDESLTARRCIYCGYQEEDNPLRKDKKIKIDSILAQ